VKRFLAVLAAVGMVAAALLVRTLIDGGGPSGANNAGDGSSDTTTIICGPDLRRFCEALAAEDSSVRVMIEDEATTTDRLATAEAGGLDADAWFTVGPAAAVLADDRSSAGLPPLELGGTSPVLARSPAVLVAASDRAEALSGACLSGITWSCIGPFAGRPWTDVGGQATWGQVRPGLASPATGGGLTVWSQAVSSETVAVDLPALWARNDLDDPSVSAWFDNLAAQSRRAGPAASDPFSRFLVAPATFGVVGALEAAAGPALQRAAGRSALSLIYPEPVVTADVTLTVPNGSDPADVIDRLGGDRIDELLAAEGWRVPSQPTAPGVGGGPPLPETSGLPAPGALSYLQQRWEAAG
jgi:hypothetical protein